MVCMWQPLNLTMRLLHNIDFPKAGGVSIEELHWNSTIFFMVLNFLNKVLFIGWGVPATWLIVALYVIALFFKQYRYHNNLVPVGKSIVILANVYVIHVNTHISYAIYVFMIFKVIGPSPCFVMERQQW